VKYHVSATNTQGAYVVVGGAWTAKDAITLARQTLCKGWLVTIIRDADHKIIKQWRVNGKSALCN